ncbi:MAG: Gfo/Idh/MocA family oxidoreductase [Verrucomicrobia bacterium]|nr:Gfo/Idh/MocA family oxidoreductase [Verrucomicrobiota bacterium]
MKKSNNTKIRLAIVGVGTRGFHSFGGMMSRRTDAEIVALGDPNAPRMKAVAAHYGLKARCYRAVAELFLREKPDGAIISSPDHTHEGNALLAINSGVPVLIEKPMATTAAACMHIIEAARTRKVAVAVGFNLRHVPVLKKAKELIVRGEIGRLMLIQNQEFYKGGRSYMARWHRKYEFSGGLWVHKGSHDFDVFNWWNSTGTPVRAACFAGVNALRPDRIPFPVKKGRPVGPRCEICRYRKICPDALLWNRAEDPIFNPAITKADGYIPGLCMYTSDKDTHDNGITILEYDNNVRASHAECFVCNFSDRRYTIVGDRGTMEISLEHPTEIRIRPRWSGEDRIVRVPHAEEGGHGGSDPELLDAFIASIRNRTAHSATARDGVRAVAVGEAAELSWRNHRMVDISELVDLHQPILNEKIP